MWITGEVGIYGTYSDNNNKFKSRLNTQIVCKKL